MLSLLSLLLSSSILLQLSLLLQSTLLLIRFYVTNRQANGQTDGNENAQTLAEFLREYEPPS